MALGTVLGIELKTGQSYKASSLRFGQYDNSECIVVLDDDNEAQNESIRVPNDNVQISGPN